MVSNADGCRHLAGLEGNVKMRKRVLEDVLREIITQSSFMKMSHGVKVRS